jgi:hypothetical protein
VENNFLSKLVMNTAQGHWNKHYTGGGKLGPGQVVFGLLTASRLICQAVLVGWQLSRL